MLSFYLTRAFFLVLMSTVAADNEFISPKYQQTSEPGAYAGDDHWELGSSQLIAFSTVWDEYRIELWQASPVKGTAKLSKTLVYNQSAEEDLAQSFYWTVQTYDLQLADMNVFFFWLRDNTDPDGNQQTSAYWNMTLASESTSSTTSSTSASGTSVTSSTSTATEPSVTSGTVISNITAASNTHQATASSETDGNQNSGGLSTGATVGLAVGVSIFGTAFLVGLGFFCWNRRRKHSETTSPPEPSTYTASEAGFSPSTQQINSQQQCSNRKIPPDYYQQNHQRHKSMASPTELGAYGQDSPAEMPT